MAKRVEVLMLNQSEIAEILGVERETISRWKQEQAQNGFPCHRDSGGDGSEDEYNVAAVMQWYLFHEFKKKVRARR